MLPGGALSGKLQRNPVEDWSSAADGALELETRPEDPYSVQLNYTVLDGELYLDPKEGRRWLAHIRLDPRVRVRFGNRLYELEATLVGRPGELDDFSADRFVYRLDPRKISVATPENSSPR